MIKSEPVIDCVVNWTQSIPYHWKVKPLWAVSHLKSEPNHQELELLSVYLNKGVVRFRDVDEKRTNVTSDDRSKYQRVSPGDLVLNNQQAWRGSVGISSYEGIVSPAYIILSLSDQLTTDFASYFFRDPVMVHQYLISSKGVGSIQRNLYFPSLRKALVCVPPIDEQQLISRYLDKKTAQIDSLIEKIERKIELLKEQRISLINQCVTKGLDPNVEMKDSGVEWIGTIPKHWERTRLKYVASSPAQYGLNIESDSYVDEGIRFLRITDINADSTLDGDGGVYLPTTLVPDEYYLKTNDILFSRSGATVGKSTRINSDDKEMAFAGYLIRFGFENPISTGNGSSYK